MKKPLKNYLLIKRGFQDKNAAIQKMIKRGQKGHPILSHVKGRPQFTIYVLAETLLRQ